jgi:hypothetical protein
MTRLLNTEVDDEMSRAVVRTCHLRTRAKGWSRAASTALCLFGMLLSGCGGGAKLVQDTGSGGVVIYPYRGDEYLVSPMRTEALQLIEKRCGGAYTIEREGQARGRNRMVENPAGTEVISDKRWALQFRCKSRDE